MRDTYSTVTRPHSRGSIIATNQVIRNTYILLSMTLLFSAGTAGLAMVTNAPFINPIISLLLFFGLFFVTAQLRNSVWGIASVFALTGFLGYQLGPMLNMYLMAYQNGSQLIMGAMGLTGIIFLSLSGYALTTQKDFSYLGGFLFVGLIVAILASIAGIFLPIPGLHIAISAAVVLIMSGYILFDTSRIIHGGETNYIMATISLYISIYNLFIHLLRILSMFAGRRD